MRQLAAFRNSLAGLRFGLLREAALREEMTLIAASLPVAPLIARDPWTLVALWGSLLLLLSIELLNTGIEKLADRVTRQDDELVKAAKDCGSAAVLMAILIAAMVWGVALWDRVFA
ncbi:diacylglycerol kinase [Stappia sp. ES.058]|uniref:diacylglycerol kinase n=1 Tax=Stappia sp. ES.058 TaxID=1881061 RepID=UPI00087A4745|nr:diacylglycerol kinase [Stappia sp. ES.058]SDT90228.1 diacylglycerol kinase (ATP) [Stappia sp. ES.058]